MLTATIHGVHRRWLRAFGLVAALVAVTALAGTGSIAQAGLSTAASARTQTVDIDPALYADLANGENPAVLVRFRGEADLSAAFGISDRDARATYVYQTLTHLADKVQAGTRQVLASQFSLSEAAHDFTVLWIDNSIAIAHLTAPMLAALQTDPNVASIREQRVIPLPTTPEVEPPGPQGTDPIVSSMEHIHVPEVWAEGFKGDGIVIANIDTGVRYTHHALVSQYRGNLGGGTFDHNFNWYDPYSHSAAPRQSDPHGSHTMGTMVGDNVDFANGGTIPRHQVGAAPDAQWMACLGFNPGATDAALIECGQWTLAPYPTNGGGTPDPTRHADIVSNSWGDCSQVYNPFYEGVITAWVAAGIAPIFSNGNAPNCGYPSPPALNTVGSPARSGKVLGIGATGTDNGVYASFSLKGITDNLNPGLPTYPDPRGFADLKPNVSAPGTNIFSSWATGDDAYALDSGTSMSAPAVAGVIALVWSAADCLEGDYAQTGTIIMSTATPRPFHSGSPSDGPGDVPNQATGWGEVDALAAVNAAIAFCAGGVTHTVTPSVGTPSGTIAPSTPQTVDDGDTIDFTLTPDSGFHINNVGGTCGGNLAGSVFTTDPVTSDCTVIANFANDGGGVFPPDENFDEVTAPALPTGWTTAASDAGVPWVTDATVSDTAPNSAHAPDMPAVGDMTLDTPSFTPAAGATLSFRHQFDLESGFDGAVLEISISGGAFQDFVDAGGVFTTGGYNDTISTCCSNPIAGRDAWSGASGGFVDVAGTFPAAAIGQPTVLRFRTADDSSFGETGWWVDTIHVGAGGGAPVADITPASLDFTVATGASASHPLNIANVGGGTLDWSVTEATAPLQPYVANKSLHAPMAGNAQGAPLRFTSSGATGSSTQAPWNPVLPDGSVTFQADDGTYETAVSLNNGTTQFPAIWFNRYSATSALTIDSISIDWPNAATAGGDVTGKAINLVAYYDADGDGDVTNAVRLGTDTMITIGGPDVFEVYPTTFSVPGPGDVYIGFVDAFASGGTSPILFAAALDEQGDPGVGYISGSSANQDPDLENLANNDLTGTISDLSGGSLAGVWMVRAVGTTGGGGGGCSNPSDVPWLSEAPTSGSVAGGDSEDSIVTVDAASLAPGSYSAHVCVATNDPTHALVDVPVNVTVNGGGGAPVIGVSPASLDDTLAQGETSDQTLTISNTGGSDLDWAITEAQSSQMHAVHTVHTVKAASSGVVTTAGAGTQMSYSYWAAAGRPALPAVQPPLARAPSGSLVVYTTLADFQAAVADPGALSSESFDGGLTPPGVVNTCTEPVNSASNDVCFTPGQLVDGFSMTSSSGLGIVVLGDGFLGQSSPVIGANTFADSTILSFGPTVTAFATDALDGIGPGPITFTAFDASDGVIGTADLTPGDINGTFIGFTSATPIARIEFASANDGGELINDMLFGDAGGGGGGGCSVPSDLPWVSVAPTSGTTTAGGSSAVTVTFDAGGLAVGSYDGLLCVASNDPVTPVVEVPVSLTVTQGGGGGIPGTFPPDENFEEQTAPNLPTDWPTAASGAGVPWVTTTTASDTAPNAAFAPEFPAVADMTVDSAVFTPVAGQTVSFRHQYNLEATFDGAVLEISIDGGAFQDIIAAGGSFESGGYDGPISTSFESPIAGRDAWNGDSGGFITTLVDLPAAAVGLPTVLRWRTADDNSVAPGTGWWVDTIHLDVGVPTGPPDATITPTSFTFSVAADETASDTLNIANAVNSDPLTFSITARESAAPLLRPHATAANSRSLHQAIANGKTPQPRAPLRLTSNGYFHNTSVPAPWAPVRPDGTVTFQADDGGYETAVSLNNGTTQFPAIWFNRYSATSALTIDSISIDWPNAATAGGDVTGKAINLVAYYDADGDGDVTNAVRLGTDTMITIGGPDVFEVYPTTFSVPGPGDVYIGFVDAFASGGTSPILFAAALDEQGDPGVGYISGSSANQDPDLDNLANNDLTGTISDLSGGSLAGVWMVRATGSGGTGGPCTGPVVTWLTANPSSGSVDGGTDTDVTVTVDPAAGGLTPGDYTAQLCVTTNDPDQALVVIPVDVTVTEVEPDDGIFCSGFEDGEDGSCGGGGGGGTPGVYDTRDEFLANVAAGYFENPFDDAVPGASPDLTYTQDGWSYTVSATTPSPDGGLFNDTGLISTNLAGDSIVVTFSGDPVTAVGGNFWATDITVQPTGTGMILTLSDGTVETYTSTGPSDFRGFITAAPVTSINIDAPDEGGTPFWPTMDNLIVGAAN